MDLENFFRLRRVAVRQQNRVIFLPLEQIDWIEAEGNYVRIHVGTDAHLHRETMREMEERLAAAGFIRISRCALVNVERVREWQPLFHGDSVLILQNGRHLSATRAYRDRLDFLLGPPRGETRRASKAVAVDTVAGNP